MRDVILPFLLAMTIAAGFQPPPETADMRITKADSPDPVTAGHLLTYSLAVQNAGPDKARDVVFVDSLPASTVFQSLASPSGWSCTVPAVDSPGSVTCSRNNLNGSSVASFTVTVLVLNGASGSLANTATVSASTQDPSTGNNSATATTAVLSSTSPTANLSITKQDSPDPVLPGSMLTYTLDVSNAGANAGANVVVTDPLPPETTFVSVSAPAGWTCATPTVSSTGTVSCTRVYLPATVANTITVAVGVAMSASGLLTNTAAVTNDTTDPSTLGNAATATTVVQSPTAVSVRSFTATKIARRVILRWHTASELGTLGFHVFREAYGSRRMRVNRRLIRPKGHGAYSFVDRRAGPLTTLRYWIQEVALDGSRSWYGPASVKTA